MHTRRTIHSEVYTTKHSLGARENHIHKVHYHDKGDFIVNEKYIFEIGGVTKGDK